jgi:predicted nucleic acid-binding protein
MERYHLSTKREAVNFALRAIAAEPLDLDELILIDSSAWVEFLRDSGSPVCMRVDDLLEGDIAICDPIRMEVLAGARNERHLGDLRRLLARATMLATSTIDYEEAAALYRVCRRSGETVRKLIDCLIASIAIRTNVTVLHADADFDVLSRHTALRSEPF